MSTWAKAAKFILAVLLVVTMFAVGVGVSQVQAASSYTMTVSYVVTGGGSPTPPTLQYIDSNGNQQTYTLTTTPNQLIVQKGSAWSVSPGNTISGSSNEQWYSANTTWSGVTPVNGGSGTNVWTYTHQLKVTFDASTAIKLDAVGTVVRVNGVDVSAAQFPYTTSWISSGSTVTYSYVSHLSSASSPTGQYQWKTTSGLGQTLQSNTFAVTSPGTVTGGYIPPLAFTSLTVSCSPTVVNNDGTASTTISGALTCAGVGLQGKTILLSYSPDGSSWTSLGSVTTGAAGSYTFTWTIPSTLANGSYAIQVVFNSDNPYQATSATTAGGGNLTVVPEYAWGSLAAFVACFAAFVLFKKRDVVFRRKHVSI